MLRFWLPVLLFLSNVETIADLDNSNCHWVCEKTLNEASARVQSGAKQIKLNKLVDGNCANNRTGNSSTWVEVWILLASRDRHPSEYSFLSFAAMFFSERVLWRQFLYGSMEYNELKSDGSSVSCVLRPASNESTTAAVNGLDTLYSPLYYIGDNVSYIQNTPFMGYVNVEQNFYFSAGFNASAEMTPGLQFDHWRFTAITVLSYLLLIVYSLYSPYMLTLFCSTVKTVHVGEIDVHVIDVGGAASPVGLRSLIANKVFSNSGSFILPGFVPFVKLFMLIIFPLFIPLWIDGLVLVTPSIFQGSATRPPPLFLTESVVIFTGKYSQCLVVCFFCYVVRIFFFSFPISPSWVPSFLCRKHLKCFIYNHYLSQLVFPNKNYSSPACNECKETPDFPKYCEIPDNIKHNHGCSLSVIFKKNRVDVFENLLQGNQGDNPCKIFLSCVFGYLVLLILCILDYIVSLPIISLCYGRVWFTVNWCKDRCFQAIFLIIEFFVICLSIVGVAYFSFCCAMSMTVALASVFFIGIKYPVEILLYSASHIIVWHILWTCYSSFTNIYDDLVLKLFNTCSENHATEFRQYKKGDAVYIPKKLFDSACEKLVPVKSSLIKLFIHLIVWVVGLFFVFSFIMAGSTDIPDSKVLSGTVTFLIVVHPSIWDFVVTRGKKKERKDAVLKEKVKDLVDDFFEGKLD